MSPYNPLSEAIKKVCVAIFSDNKVFFSMSIFIILAIAWNVLTDLPLLQSVFLVILILSGFFMGYYSGRLDERTKEE